MRLIDLSFRYQFCLNNNDDEINVNVYKYI